MSSHNILRCREGVVFTRLQKQTKTIICVDCGREFEVGSKASRRTRCDECYDKHRKEAYRKSKQKMRELKMSTEQN